MAVSSGNPPSGFFPEIATYAKQKGMQIFFIEGMTGHKAATRMALEQLNKKWSVERWTSSNNVKPEKFVDTCLELISREAATNFPSSYVNYKLRDEQMVRRVKKYQLQAIMVGGQHAVGIADLLQIPVKEIHFIGKKIPARQFRKHVQVQKAKRRNRKIVKRIITSFAKLGLRRRPK